MKNEEKSLRDRHIALPESRQLDVLSAMLEKRGAQVIRCPLVAILDNPDRGAVLEWLQRVTERPFDDFIILTGEGLRRLNGFAQGVGKTDEFIRALGQMRKIVRGPKPGQALRELGLKPDLVAVEPTTDGVIAILGGQELKGRRVGVQLYGEDPNKKLIDYLRSRNADPDAVSPYVYASESDDVQVGKLIASLAAGEIDAIAFTSQPQYRRLQEVAIKLGKEAELKTGLEKTTVAAVGPVMAGALEAAGVRVDMVPDTNYFMKPMVSGLEALFAGKPRKS
ncbi:MAG TPA: uroporphyrinogen-III synthase [Gammaproteobacteria bacterium]